jgi:hypothetical protein
MALAGLDEAAADMRVTTTVEHSEHFRPGRPQPTHRLATV